MLAITWLRHPQLVHAEMAVVTVKRGLYFKVGLLVKEHANPARPKGGVIPAKPWGVELYVPLTQGQEKVQKFDTERAARERIAKAVEYFAATVMEVSV